VFIIEKAFVQWVLNIFRDKKTDSAAWLSLSPSIMASLWQEKEKS
jgi:hypothetical protein